MLLAAKAVVAGLSCASIARMRSIVDDVHNHPQFAQPMETLKVCFSVNPSDLRSVMTAKLPPIIPYLGLYQTDLVKIYEGNKKRLANNLINFQRYLHSLIVARIIIPNLNLESDRICRIRLIGKVLREVARCQKTPHAGLNVNRVVQVWCSIFRVLATNMTFSSITYCLYPSSQKRSLMRSLAITNRRETMLRLPCP